MKTLVIFIAGLCATGFLCGNASAQESKLPGLDEFKRHSLNELKVIYAKDPRAFKLVCRYKRIKTIGFVSLGIVPLTLANPDAFTLALWGGLGAYATLRFNKTRLYKEIYADTLVKLDYARSDSVFQISLKEFKELPYATIQKRFSHNELCRKDIRDHRSQRILAYVVSAGTVLLEVAIVQAINPSSGGASEGFSGLAAGLVVGITTIPLIVWDIHLYKNSSRTHLHSQLGKNYRY